MIVNNIEQFLLEHTQALLKRLRQMRGQGERPQSIQKVLEQIVSGLLFTQGLCTRLS